MEKKDHSKVSTGLVTHKPLFVVSDLHMGNGSSLDQFKRAEAEPLFLDLLDYVTDQEGQLIIAGDLLELWRFPLTEVIDHRQRLLERLAQMHPVYITGNHDFGAASAPKDQGHPLLLCIRSPLTVPIGDRRFRFMHGHEQDPLINRRVYSQTVPGFLYPAFSLKDRMCRWTGDLLPNLFLEGSERALGFLHGLRGSPLHRIHPALRHGRKWPRRRPGQTVRTQKMLSRYHYDRDKNDYDVAVVGHSHKAGQYGDWYFNSGCWIGETHSFLRIWPDGHVEVFDWEDGGHRPSQIVARNGLSLHSRSDDPPNAS